MAHRIFFKWWSVGRKGWEPVVYNGWRWAKWCTMVAVRSLASWKLLMWSWLLREMICCFVFQNQSFHSSDSNTQSACYFHRQSRQLKLSFSKTFLVMKNCCWCGGRNRDVTKRDNMLATRLEFSTRSSLSSLVLELFSEFSTRALYRL